ncbi:unnamed protein product [Calypogeia fissa]
MEGQKDEAAAIQAGSSVMHRNKGRRNGKPITEKWRPVYIWLEALNQREVVKATEITDWLEAHPEVRLRLRMNHTNEHIFNYIQKCHTRMIHDPRARSHNVKADKEKQAVPVTLPEGRLKRSHKKMFATQPSNVRVQPDVVRRIRKRRWGVFKNEGSGLTGVRQARAGLLGDNNRDVLDRGKQVVNELSGCPSSDVTEAYLGMDQNAARTKFELLAALHKELVHFLSNFKELRKERTVRADNVSEASSQSQPGTIGPRARDPVAVFAWSFSEASSGMDPGLLTSNGRNKFNERSRAGSSDVAAIPDKGTSIFKCLTEREMGGNSGTVAFRPQDIGSHGRHWTSFVAGWNSLDNQFKGPISWLQQHAYSSWSASWCAYTSSVALAPLGGVDQGVQKVLDLRLHPGGLPQLVCSCNAAPNELLLYNLMNGRARELPGHNCQIQAVEYALNGERIVSCGTNILKVWDSASGTCLHTMGPVENEGASGHKKKISAMAVHQLQSSGLLATSGGEGESEILLWNVRTGELASDLNGEIRQRSSYLQSMDALKFCHHNLLICGSDSAGSQPAVVQIWDVDAIKALMTFPASDSYITCLSTDPQGSTIITGAGDSSVGLFDIRTGGAIARLPLGLKSEATSVAFSACGTYFHSSSTANHTLVWDTRMMPMEPGLMPKERPVAVSKLNSRSSRPLHCLSHGNPMPTTQNAGQLPGFVDEGDGGVNDARWCQGAPVLVTASGNGSVAIWDVTLGQPCLRLLSSHSRCINTVVVSTDDQLICSGGDDQKVVLYHSSKAELARGWRLTHPLSEELQPAARADQS